MSWMQICPKHCRRTEYVSKRKKDQKDDRVTKAVGQIPLAVKKSICAFRLPDNWKTRDHQTDWMAQN